MLNAVFLAALVALAACATSPPLVARRCEGGRFTTPADLARVSGCPEIRGDVVIAGGLRELSELASLRAVRGSLAVGPGLHLASIEGLRALERVGGELRIASNPRLRGVFLPSLGEVGGSLSVEHNLSLETLSLHRVERVGGSLRVRDNASLIRVDLSELESLGGGASLERNGRVRELAGHHPAVAAERAKIGLGGTAP